MCRSAIAALLAGLCLATSGCGAPKPFRISDTVEVLQGISTKIPLRAGIVVSEATKSYALKPESFLGSLTVSPFGEAVENISLKTFSQVFDQAIVVRGAPNFDLYDVLIEPTFVGKGRTRWYMRGFQSKSGFWADTPMEFIVSDRNGIVWRRQFTEPVDLAPYDDGLSGVPVSKKVIQAAMEMRADLAREDFLKKFGVTRQPGPVPTDGKVDKTSEPLSKTDLREMMRQVVRETVQAPGPTTAHATIRSDVDAPPYRLSERPDDFALVVGVEKYDALPSAEFAERDAAAVREHLLALGFPERNIVYLTGSKASRAGLAKNLESWLIRNAGDKSTVFFYFSGHGAPDPKTGQAYLVPFDGDTQFLEETAYPVKRLYQRLNDIKAKSVIVTLDACFPGAGGRSVLAKGTRPLVSRIDAGKDAAGRLVVFTAAGEAEITGTEESQGHGVFTYYFLKGLSGDARDKNGRITARGLYDYLVPLVQNAARRQNRDQRPSFLAPSDSAEILLRSR